MCGVYLVATAKFIDTSDFEIRLNRSATDFKRIAEKAIRAGAAIIATRMQERLNDVLSVDAQNGKLVQALGITPVKRGRNFDYNAHIGFDGYQLPAYGKFPQGVPFQLIARTFESGAGDWRPKTPFAKPAVNDTKEQVRLIMNRVAEEEFQKIMEGK